MVFIIKEISAAAFRSTSIFSCGWQIHLKRFNCLHLWFIGGLKKYSKLFIFCTCHTIQTLEGLVPCVSDNLVLLKFGVCYNVPLKETELQYKIEKSGYMRYFHTFCILYFFQLYLQCILQICSWECIVAFLLHGLTACCL